MTRGIVLVETLVALAIFSLISLSTLNMIGNLSVIVDQPVRMEFYSEIQKLSREPSLHATEPYITLVEKTVYESGSVWRVYRFTDSNTKNFIDVPIYYPEGQNSEE